jgi:hypothetical protein
LDASCDLTGLLTGTEKEIGAGGADDRRAGILRDHEASERRLAARTRQRQISFDEERCAIGVQGLVDGDRSPRGQRNPLGADRLALIIQSNDTKEYDLPILQADHPGRLGIVAHPFANALGGHFLPRHKVALDQ